MKILTINCKPDLSYFTNRGLNIETTYKKISKIFPVSSGSDTINEIGQIVTTSYPDPTEYLNKYYNTGEYDIILIGYNRREYKKYKDLMSNTGGKTFTIPLMPYRTYYSVYCLENNNYAVHELHHILCAILVTKYGKIVRDFMDIDSKNRPYFLNNEPENPLSNYAQTWNTIKPYVNLLNGTMKTWKHFKLTEKTGSLGHTVADLDTKLVDMLDELRDKCGFPFVITSGYRTPEENKKVGGVAGSSHTQRLAVDIACTDAKKRMSIVGNAWNMGFIGIGIHPIFLHLDLNTKENKRIWLY